MKITPNDFIWECSKECGSVYSFALAEFWKQNSEQGKWLNKFDLQKHLKGKIEKKLLHSDSFIGAMQKVHDNLNSWKEAKKINPGAKPPYKSRFLQPIRFKKSQIRFKDGNIILTLGNVECKDEGKYFSVKWDKALPRPQYGEITYDKTRGWKLSFVLEQENDNKQCPSSDSKNVNILSVDLGVKRIATIYDGKECVTISGKKLLGLIYYQNKMLGKKQATLSKKKKGGKNYKKLQRAWRRANDRLQNIKQDCLHKISRGIVNYSIDKDITHIVIGDSSSTHDKTNIGKENQKINQFPEQRLKKLIEYKFKQHGGITDIIPEPYTSRTCICCGHVKNVSPQGRIYKCSKCGYTYDRDGVGAVNIYSLYVFEHLTKKKEFSNLANENKNVSFGLNAGRNRLLTRPLGVKFHSGMLLMKSKFLLSQQEQKRSKKPQFS